MTKKVLFYAVILLALTAFNASAQQAATVDIKPGSCENPVNVKSKGIVTVAVLGSADLEAADVAASTQFSLQTPDGISITPVRYSIEDVATAGVCDEETPDGYADIILKFRTQQLAAALGPVARGDVVELTLVGTANDEVVLSGSDKILIKKKKVKVVAAE
ncbi:MAG: hypothetical protein ACLGPL_02645 [Acidobacteriota bacterium]